MARSVEEINQFIVDQLVINFGNVGITIDPTKWSKRDLLRVICFTVAIAQALMEQLQDLFQSNLEAINAVSAASSAPWLQSKMFQFQYSATDPQVLSLIDVSPQYAIVDPTLRIIAACSVKSTVSNQVKIKIAQGSPLTSLDGLQLAAAQGYINQIGTAGITYTVISLDPDRLYIKGTVYFQGQYAAVIQANVIAALNTYLENASKINFDGSIKITDVIETIRNVPGVNDFLPVNIRARRNLDDFVDGTDLVVGQTIISRLWNTVAGYIIQEDTGGDTFSDSLTFIAQ